MGKHKNIDLGIYSIHKQYSTYSMYLQYVMITVLARRKYITLLSSPFCILGPVS